jgi:hypothetical protein
MSEGGYTEEQIRDIKRKVLHTTIRRLAVHLHTKFAPDFFVEQTMAQADEFIERYKDKPDIDIWRNGRLDLYTVRLVNSLIIQFRFDYELSRENLEAVENLKEAEEMLGDKVSDRELFLMFDYEPEELKRLRILAKYTGKLDADEIYHTFAKKYHLE